MFRPRISILFLGSLSLLLGCGGGGGASSSTSGELCGPASYSPNFIDSITPKRWSGLPIKVYFKTTTVGAGSTLEDRYREGFNDWEEETGVNLWEEVSTESAANLTVETQIVAPQGTLGVTTIYFFEGQSTIQRAEMVIYAWPSLPTTGYKGTAAHEFGHSMGINGHSPVSADIMYFTGNSTDLLTTSDINTLRSLYCNFGSIGKVLPNVAGLTLKSTRIECPMK